MSVTPYDSNIEMTGPSSARRFWIILVGIAALGLGVRVLAMTYVRPECPTPITGFEVECFHLGGDPQYVKAQAHWLIQGELFIDGATANLWGISRPGAAHLPLPTVVGALAEIVDLGDDGGLRFTYSCIGALGVIAAGAAARAVDPRRRNGPAFVSGAIAAAYPVFWVRDIELTAESVLMPLAALTILAAYRYRAAPSWPRAGILGLTIGACWLTRGEAGLLLGAIALPLCLRTMAVPLRHRAAHLGAVTAITALLIAPWVLFNHARFNRPTYLTTSTGITVLLSSCDNAFEGFNIGYYSASCGANTHQAPVMGDESDADAQYLADGLAYLGSHKGQIPIVAVNRFGRIWNLYPYDESWHKLALADFHGSTTATLELFTYYPVFGLALVGLAHLLRRRSLVAPLVGWGTVVTLTAVLFAAVSRYRAGADVAMVILAGIGFCSVTQLLRDRATGRTAASDPLELAS